MPNIDTGIAACIHACMSHLLISLARHTITYTLKQLNILTSVHSGQQTDGRRVSFQGVLQGIRKSRPDDHLPNTTTQRLFLSLSSSSLSFFLSLPPSLTHTLSLSFQALPCDSSVPAGLRGPTRLQHHPHVRLLHSLITSLLVQDPQDHLPQPGVTLGLSLSRNFEAAMKWGRKDE